MLPSQRRDHRPVAGVEFLVPPFEDHAGDPAPGQFGQQLVRAERVDLVARGVGVGDEVLRLGQRLDRGPGVALDLVGTLERDLFQGLPRLRIRVVDYADASGSPLVARRLARVTPIPVGEPSALEASPA